MSSILIYEYWYAYIKSKYGDKAELCYTDTNSLIVHVESDVFFTDLASDAEKRFEISNYEVKILLIIRKKKVIGLIKDQLRGIIMIGFVALRPFMKKYLADDGHFDKRKKGTKKCVAKGETKFEFCNTFLEIK